MRRVVAYDFGDLKIQVEGVSPADGKITEGGCRQTDFLRRCRHIPGQLDRVYNKRSKLNRVVRKWRDRKMNICGHRSERSP
jgi:hypothetical protein